LGLPGVREREFRLKLIWCKDVDSRYIIMCLSVTTECDKTHPKKPTSIVASANSVWMFEKMPPIGGVPQTKVTLMSTVDLKGILGARATKTVAVKFMKIISTLRLKHDRSRDMNAYNRSQIVEKLSGLVVDSSNDFEKNFADTLGMDQVYGAFPLFNT